MQAFISASILRRMAFTITHRHFYVFGTYTYPEDWLLPKLHDDKATLRLVAHLQTSYKDKDLTISPCQLWLANHESVGPQEHS